jgi:NAD(P)H-nitrite reductase large subunit
MSYDKNQTLCFCFDITYGDLEKKIKDEKLKSFDDVLEKTKIGLACGACKDDIQIVIDNMTNTL